jgi:hypothetical protein
VKPAPRFDPKDIRNLEAEEPMGQIDEGLEDVAKPFAIDAFFDRHPVDSTPFSRTELNHFVKMLNGNRAILVVLMSKLGVDEVVKNPVGRRLDSHPQIVPLERLRLLPYRQGWEQTRERDHFPVQFYGPEIPFTEKRSDMKVLAVIASFLRSIAISKRQQYVSCCPQLVLSHHNIQVGHDAGRWISERAFEQMSGALDQQGLDAGAIPMGNGLSELRFQPVVTRSVQFVEIVEVLPEVLGNMCREISPLELDPKSRC